MRLLIPIIMIMSLLLVSCSDESGFYGSGAFCTDSDMLPVLSDGEKESLLNTASLAIDYANGEYISLPKKSIPAGNVVTVNLIGEDGAIFSRGIAKFPCLEESVFYATFDAFSNLDDKSSLDSYDVEIIIFGPYGLIEDKQLPSGSKGVRVLYEGGCFVYLPDMLLDDSLKDIDDNAMIQEFDTIILRS